MSCTCESYNSYICPQCQPEETKTMKPTLEQLNMLSDYELNCAIAEKKGYVVKERYKDTGIIILDIIHEGKHLIRPVDYCNVPNDYMPIAIGYGININFDSVDSNEFDTGYDWVSCSYLNSKCDMALYLRNKTGRAVGIAFLLMELKVTCHKEES